MLTLYHHGSSVCAAKVRFVFAEKKLLWEGRYLDILKGDQYTPEFRAINPKAVVPVLVHEEHIITESTVICEYAEEVFPVNPVYPTSPYLRAKIRTWTKAVDEELHPACSAITFAISHRYPLLRNGVGTFEEFMKKGSAMESAASRKLKWQWINEGVNAPDIADKIRLYDRYIHKMNEALSNTDWLVGDQFSMADIAMAPYVNRLSAMAMDDMWCDGRLPHVERWFDRVRARPTFKPAFLDWMPADLTSELHSNGRKSWPEIRALLNIK